MKETLAFCLVLFLYTSGQSQISFQRSYGGSEDERGHAVVVTQDGGYAIAGFTTSFGAGAKDLFIIKVDSLGVIKWQKTYGGTLDEFGYSVLMKESNDVGLVLVGAAQGDGDHTADALVMKVDMNGNLLWSNIYDTGTFQNSGDHARGLNFTVNGDILISGTDDGDSFGSNDGLLMRLSPDGTLLWKKVFGGNSNEHLHEPIELPGGNILVCGSTQTYGPGPRAGLVIKTDHLGNLIWAKTYGGPAIEFLHGMVMTDEFDIVIGGITSSFGAGEDDFLLFKMDSSGVVEWTRTFGGPFDDWGVSLIHAPDKTGYVITGYSDSFGNGQRDILIVRTDLEGQVIWAKTFGTGGYESVDTWAYTTIALAQDNGYVLTGWSDSLSISQEDILLIKTDELGDAFCTDVDVTMTSPEMTTDNPDPGVASPGTFMSLNMTVSSPSFASSEHCYCSLDCDVCEITIVEYNLDDCYSNTGNGSDMDYSEFVPFFHLNLSYADITASILHRENAASNKHSCTPGINSSPAMCVSSLNSCSYDPGNTQSVVFELTVTPDPDSAVQITGLSFYEKAPTVYDWINGPSGPNNYPTLFGVRVLKNGTEIYRAEDLPTTVNIWTLESFDFSNELDFTASTPATYRFELLGYCLVNNGASVTAWDLDQISVRVKCEPVLGAKQNIFGFVRTAVVSPMQNVEVLLADNPDFINALSTRSDQEGYYRLGTSHSNQTRFLKAYYNEDMLYGVNTLDLVLLQKYLLGITPFTSAQQMIAADVNNSKTVSVLDLLTLRQLILRKITAFPNNTSWRFMDQDQHLSMSNPWILTEVFELPNANVDMQRDFLAIKVGDINRDARNTLISRENPDPVVFKLSKPELKSSSEGLQQINFTSADFNNICGFQFVLKLDENINFYGMQPGVVPVTEDNYSLSEGRLYLSWSQATPLTSKPDDILFSLLIQSGHGKAHAIALERSPLLAETYQETSSGIHALAISLENDDVLNTTQPFIIASPNPFSTNTTLSFSLNEYAYLKIGLYDSSGRLLRQISGGFGQGVHEIIVTREELDNYYGVLFCRVKKAGSVEVEKLIRIE